MQISATARPTADQPDLKCPYCLDQIGEVDRACCDRCGTWHHAGCMKAHGSCTMIGCDGRAKIDYEQLHDIDIAAEQAKLKNRSLISRYNALNRLIRQGCPSQVLEKIFAVFDEDLIQLGLLGARVREGHQESAVQLLTIAFGEDAQRRHNTISILASLPEQVPGTFLIAAKYLPWSPGPCRRILQRASAIQLCELTAALDHHKLTKDQVIDALVASLGPMSVRARRLNVIDEFVTVSTSNHALVFAEAAKTKAHIASLPNVQAIPTEDFVSQLKTFLPVGLFVAAAVLLFGTFTESLFMQVLGTSLAAATLMFVLLTLIRLVHTRRSFLREQREINEHKATQLRLMEEMWDAHKWDLDSAPRDSGKAKKGLKSTQRLPSKTV